MTLTKKQFKKIIKTIPMIGTDGVLFKNGSVLLVKRAHKPYRGCWALPGGFIEYKERLEHAIVREVKEESGLDVRVKGLIGIYDSPGRDPRGHLISICFLLKLVGGKPRTSNETSDVKFFKKIPYKIAADHRKIIMDAKKLIKNQ